MHFVLYEIMPLYKAWDVGKKKRKAIYATNFVDFVCKGELLFRFHGKLLMIVFVWFSEPENFVLH